MNYMTKKVQCSHHNMNITALPRLPVTTGCKYREVLATFSEVKMIMHYDKEIVNYVYLSSN